ncbi:hypothetical protein CSPX01_00640 [Colletotrichum filicis]|nr:hypothetical protein CSPX01_00640 [Colletotrichum filicis]
MALTRAGMMHRDRISLDELFCPIIMAEETQCYGDGTLFCYGFDTTSYYDDGTSASHDSGVSDVEDFSELSLDMLERHGKYWDAQSIGDWNAQSINYARYGRALGVTALHDYVCVCIAGATVPSRIFQDLSESINPGTIIDVQFGGLIATSEKSHDNPPTNEMLAELRADNVHGRMIEDVERMMGEAGLVPQSMRTFSIPSASTVARTFQTGDLWSTRPIEDGVDSYLSTWAKFQPEGGVKMFL